MEAIAHGAHRTRGIDVETQPMDKTIVACDRTAIGHE
jgi:hypothetical protein